jgi:HPt (histidine-containing phosphotransfer) domain-containing protein
LLRGQQSIFSKRFADNQNVTFSKARAEFSEQRTEDQPKCPSFDLPRLIDLFDGDDAAIGHLLQAAITSIRGEAAAISAAAGAADRQTILDCAHRLKGTSGTIGDRRLLRISIQIEDAARSTAFPPPPLLAALREAVDRLGAEIAAVVLAAE